MRISQRQMFTTYTAQMNGSLSALMESNNQGGSGKRINRPSDDPAGMARVMMYRESLSNIERNKANISEATGWLNLADHALMGVSDIITKIKTLDLQSASETQSADNRQQNATQLRGYFGELMNWANEKYNGQHIFAGHKVEQPAYVMGANVTTADENLDNIDFIVQSDGSSDYSTLIQFTSQQNQTDLDPAVVPPPSFIYSKDGGDTWEYGTWDTSEPGKNIMLAGGTRIELRRKDDTQPWGTVTPVTPNSTPPAQAADYAAAKESAGGTWLTVRPTAVYQGDDHDVQTTKVYDPGGGITGEVITEGSFTRDVTVRIREVANGTITYEYSLDNGSNWIDASAPDTSTRLAIPGGYLSLQDAADSFAAGQEFLVHPRRADINFEISSNQTVTVNMVGKEIFGGLYQEPFTDYAATVEGPNLFETVGKLIGYCEINDSDGIAQCLEELDDCQKYIGTRLAEVGGRENRLQVAFETASVRELSETTAMSAIEDVDTITLMTKLAQQQLAYNTVLKSSSMIMQMSLMNFI